MKFLLTIFGFLLSFSMAAQVSWNVDSVYNWRDKELPLDGRNRTYNEVWGFEINAREYAVIGSREGTYIVDITRVLEPTLVKFIPGAHNDGTNRDYHDYNGYLYMVCDQGQSSLQIVDLHNLPYEAPVIYDSDSLFVRCHNIFVDTVTAHLYACSVSKQDSLVDLEIYDISTSPIPKLLLTYDNPSIDGFHDIFVQNDTAYGNNGRSGLFMYDFSDMKNPNIIGSILDYPDQGYNHAGYASEDGEYYYFSDETHGTDMKVVKVNDLDNSKVVGTFNSGYNTDEIIVHNLLVRDNLLFVSYYHEGLQIFDLDDPKKPQKVGRYYTYTDRKEDGSKDYSGYSGAWGVYPYLPSGFILVSDREKGLFVFDISAVDGKLHPELLPSKRIFPNPAGNYVDLVYPFGKVKNVQLIDINGRLVDRSAKIQEINFITRISFTKSMPSGVYFLKVESESGTFVEKLIKE